MADPLVAEHKERLVCSCFLRTRSRNCAHKFFCPPKNYGEKNFPVRERILESLQPAGLLVWFCSSVRPPKLVDSSDHKYFHTNQNRRKCLACFCDSGGLSYFLPIQPGMYYGCHIRFFLEFRNKEGCAIRFHNQYIRFARPLSINTNSTQIFLLY